MKQIKLYPPGGGTPIIPHPSKLKEMEDKGWTRETLKQPKQEKKHGNSYR